MKEKRANKDKAETEANRHTYERELSENNILILRVMYQTNVAVPML
jgi:hypothetical protein